MTLSADRVTDLNSCVAHTSSETEYFCHPGTFFLSLFPTCLVELLIIPHLDNSSSRWQLPCLEARVWWLRIGVRLEVRGVFGVGNSC